MMYDIRTATPTKKDFHVIAEGKELSVASLFRGESREVVVFLHGFACSKDLFQHAWRDPGVDYETATSAAIASLGNIGPGLSKVGATCTYAWMAPSAKMILSLAMLLGRLEVYTVLVVLLPTFWKK